MEMFSGGQAGAGHGSALGPPLPTAYKREAAQEDRGCNTAAGAKCVAGRR